MSRIYADDTFLKLR